MSQPTLDERRCAAGLSVAALARAARVRYFHVWIACTAGAALSRLEQRRIAAVLRSARRLAKADR
jgi:hypothetical protein